MQASQREVERQSVGKSNVGLRFVLNGQEVKSCRRCGRVRPLDDFPIFPHSWDQLSCWCKDCPASEAPHASAAPRTAQTPGGSIHRSRAGYQGAEHSRRPTPTGTGSSSSSGQQPATPRVGQGTRTPEVVGP